jgi:hypothetical protein
MLPLGGALAMWASEGLHPASNQYKEIDQGVLVPLQPLQKLYDYDLI